MDNKQKNILIAVLSAIILILLVIIGTGALKGDGDKSGTSSETSDIISADHFQDSADVTTSRREGDHQSCDYEEVQDHRDPDNHQEGHYFKDLQDKKDQDNSSYYHSYYYHDSGSSG